MSFSLLKVYQHHVLLHNLEAHPAQEKLITQLQDLCDQLARLDNRQSLGLLKFWKRKADLSPSPKGIYLWGSVGCGKTFLLNLFFNHVPLQRKKRLHFHEFMRGIHTLLAEYKNTSDPLQKVARRYADEAGLLYLDEFHIIDIGDAMILGELLRHLLARGTVLLTTSNFPPSRLYRDGLQRERFLPAIRLLENRLQVIELRTDCDYRLKFFTATKLYSVLSDGSAESALENSFGKIISDLVRENVLLEINGRSISAKKIAGGVVWFDFQAICGSRRSPADYLEIAKCYETIFVSDIPVFEDRDDLARRFINMIDAFYDHRVRLVASAEDVPEHLYRRGRLREEFQRTASRLIEMQSPGYVARIHA